jgi:hypothetical protein
MRDNKAIINYLKDLIEEQNISIERDLKYYPEYKDRDTFCHDCGYHTEDISYHEKYIKNFLEFELKKLEEIELCKKHIANMQKKN